MLLKVKYNLKCNFSNHLIYKAFKRADIINFFIGFPFMKDKVSINITKQYLKPFVLKMLK